MVDTDLGEIAREGRRWGADVPFLRDPALAQDQTSTVDSTIAVLDRLAAAGETYETVVLLQPTSPLRSGNDILRCWEGFDPSSSPSVASICELEHPAELILRRNPDGILEWRDAGGGWLRRQDTIPAYRLTGAVYVIAAKTLRSERQFVIPGVTRGVVIDVERSLDIDTDWDLDVAESWFADRTTPAVAIGKKNVVGGGAPCFVIAEAGVNHNGDSSLAHRLVDVAADAQADAVKFQTFEPESLATPEAPKAEYQTKRTGRDETQLEMLRRLVLPRAEFAALARHAEERSILFLSTAFDEASADYLEELGVPAFKVPSGEITNHAFLAHLARKKRPLLISTGMSSLEEVDEALRVVRENGAPPLALFHCVTNYPASPAECNLLAMETMRRAFGVPVGWSDHTLGLNVSLAAVATGAELLEKHFTLDRGMPGPDHAASLEPGELIDLVRSVREVERARGTGIKVPTSAELANAGAARRSLHAARDLPRGHTIGEDDLVALRPGTGLPPSSYSRLLGRTIKAPLREGEMLRQDHLV